MPKQLGIFYCLAAEFQTFINIGRSAQVFRKLNLGFALDFMFRVLIPIGVPVAARPPLPSRGRQAAPGTRRFSFDGPLRAFDPRRGGHARADGQFLDAREIGIAQSTDLLITAERTAGIHPRDQPPQRYRIDLDVVVLAAAGDVDQLALVREVRHGPNGRIGRAGFDRDRAGDPVTGA